MQRITDKMLQARFDLINKTLGRPLKPWKIQDGRSIGQVGCFHLAQQNDHNGCHEMLTDGGAVDQHGSWGTKRELYDYLGGLLDGLELGR